MYKPRKKMTLKEFKRIFNLAYGENTFNDYGYEYILNKLSLHEYHSAEEDKSMGFKCSAEESNHRSITIYNELDKIGYYSR